jgi:predicted O-linked N-acetylglucosamine transferase (SPINDLY family)
MSLDFLSKEDDISFKRILELYSLGNFLEASQILENLKEKYPDNFILENIHGLIFSSQGKYEDALLMLTKAIKIKPDFVEGYYNIGTTYLKTEKFKEAIIYFKKSLDIKKNYLNSYFNLADCYKRLGEISEAINNYNNYIKHKPEDEEAYNNLGKIYFELKDHEKAKYNLNKALSINIGSVDANFYMGLILSNEKKYILAVNFLQRTIDLDKSLYLAYLELAKIFRESLKLYEAINVLKNFIDKNLDQQNSLSDCYNFLGRIQIQIGDINGAYKSFDLCLSFPKKNSNHFKPYIFSYNYNVNFNKKKYFELINDYKKLLNIKKDYKNKFSYKDCKKIKLGFLSSDFRDHAVGYQIIGVLEKLKLEKDFELFGYSLNTSDSEDELSKRFKLLFNCWFDVTSLDAISIAEKIRSDKVQILFDLNGFTGGNLIEVFIHRPAPIQISWAGYLASTGLEEIDYVVIDPYIFSDQFNLLFTEKPLILKNIWSILTYFEDVNISQKIPFHNNGYITFGSFNSLPKINDEVIKIWSTILNKVENSQLLIIALGLKDEKVKNNLKKLFYNYLVRPEQLIFKEDLSRKELFNQYNLVDIALDTFPYGGGTTSLEASWMCVPILTKSGDSFLSRCGESINSNLGMTDWICKNNDEYIIKAIKFSSDIKNLQKIKDYLLNNRDQTSLFNSELFAKNFTDVLKRVWKDYSNKKIK